jgi:hypothetical protein
MKLGKLAPVRYVKTPAFGDFLAKANEWPAVKPQGWEYAFDPSLLEMLGNDQYGDCGEAGAMHFIQTETANTGQPLHGTLEQTLALYSAVTGFNPNAAPDASGNNPTDNGTVLLDLLKYWRDQGIEVTDNSGNKIVHRILGWAALDLSSVAQMRYACYVFGGVYLGIQCPQSAMADPSNWIYVPGSPIEGGHCINGTGEGSQGGHLQSWGLNIPYSWEFLLKYLDEGYAIVSKFWVDQQGKSPSGMDLDGLLNAMKSL